MSDLTEIDVRGIRVTAGDKLSVDEYLLMCHIPKGLVSESGGLRHLSRLVGLACADAIQQHVSKPMEDDEYGSID